MICLVILATPGLGEARNKSSVSSLARGGGSDSGGGIPFTQKPKLPSGIPAPVVVVLEQTPVLLLTKAGAALSGVRVTVRDGMGVVVDSELTGVHGLAVLETPQGGPYTLEIVSAALAGVPFQPGEPTLILVDA